MERNRSRTHPKMEEKSASTREDFPHPSLILVEPPGTTSSVQRSGPTLAQRLLERPRGGELAEVGVAPVPLFEDEADRAAAHHEVRIVFALQPPPGQRTR